MPPCHRGMSILLVEQDSPGYTVTRDLGKLGYKGPETCEVVLDDVRVPVDCLLGGIEGRGLQQALSALEMRPHQHRCSGGGCVGSVAARRSASIRSNAMHLVSRSLSSKQYNFKSCRYGHRESRRRACLPSGPRQNSTLASAPMLKRVWPSSSHQKRRSNASLDAMRIHGAYGYSTELDIERYYRDAPLMAIGEGTNDILRTVIARGLTSR